MAVSSPRAKHWTRVEYERLIDLGAPEPDIAVVPGSRRDHSRAHPSHPVLIVEVADSSLAFDRAEKGSLYARAGIADYWILNLPDQVLEVYREPVAAPHAPYGHHFGATITLAPRDTVSPLAAATAAVLVASLLPWARSPARHPPAASPNFASRVLIRSFTPLARAAAP
jgi:hypothetical protein